MDILFNFYNIAELVELAFYFRVDYESLPATEKMGKAIELYKYMERHGKLDRLKKRIQQDRAHLFD